VTTAIFAFTLSMQEYLYAVVFSSPVDQRVVRGLTAVSDQ
jgi:ABC-type glycerol-3-phosphate transport system permease component